MGDMEANVQKLIDKVIKDHFGDVQIDAVHVEEDFDADGERILRVTVVFDAKKGLDPAKSKGLVRHMRSALTETNDYLFPIIAFRSRADAKRLKAAAA